MTHQTLDERPRATADTRAESPLGWLRRRKDKSGERLITAEQFAAGERLATDFLLAAMNARTTVSWGAVGGGARKGGTHAVDMSDAILAAKQRVTRALTAVGPELCGILIDVCCYEQGLEYCERAGGWPARSAKLVLQMALSRLARHYGLLPPELPAGLVHRDIQHWGTGDYRPTIDGT